MRFVHACRGETHFLHPHMTRKHGGFPEFPASIHECPKIQRKCRRRSLASRTRVRARSARTRAIRDFNPPKPQSHPYPKPTIHRTAIPTPIAPSLNAAKAVMCGCEKRVSRMPVRAKCVSGCFSMRPNDPFMDTLKKRRSKCTMQNRHCPTSN